MISLLGLALFALAECAFDYFATKGNTNWHIFYFSCTYLSMLLVAFDVLYRENNIVMQLASLAFSCLYLFLIINEIRFVNVPFDTYIHKVNDSKINFLIFGLLSIALIYITAVAWAKKQSKT